MFKYILYRHRYYNPLLSPPISNDLDISLDNLDEFHGFENDYERMEDGISFNHHQSIIDEPLLEEIKVGDPQAMMSNEETKS
jgi:hypothetical protein